MNWIYLLLAGSFEVVSVMGINKVKKCLNWQAIIMLAGGFVLSFSLLFKAMQTISMGTSYAIWTGIGTVGSTLVGMFIYGESKDWRRILFITMVLTAAIGLKLIS